ncbi:hypothetical protein TWF106_010305 [Orbilia oligospora]|uniref:Uncharacterized protein n=1 Tax=Orbilia oligospora TaxID=2813651 RepID=A0A7C8UE40_ORBOL|nr:hypothetical protein TWF106_010305 [Orbilia oligospora]
MVTALPCGLVQTLKIMFRREIRAFHEVTLLLIRLFLSTERTAATAKSVGLFGSGDPADSLSTTAAETAMAKYHQTTSHSLGPGTRKCPRAPLLKVTPVLFHQVFR